MIGRACTGDTHGSCRADGRGDTSVIDAAGADIGRCAITNRCTQFSLRQHRPGFRGGADVLGRFVKRGQLLQGNAECVQPGLVPLQSASVEQAGPRGDGGAGRQRRTCAAQLHAQVIAQADDPAGAFEQLRLGAGQPAQLGRMVIGPNAAAGALQYLNLVKLAAQRFGVVAGTGVGIGDDGGDRLASLIQQEQVGDI